MQELLVVYTDGQNELCHAYKSYKKSSIGIIRQFLNRNWVISASIEKNASAKDLENCIKINL